MTEQRGGAGNAPGPPWSVDMLADLHAGVLDDAASERLWPMVLADPDALAVIEALDATKADLAALRDAPSPPMPAHVAARIDAALAQEPPVVAPGPSAHPAPVVDLAAARRRRNRQLGWGAGLLTAAAVAVAAIAITVPTTTTGGDPGMAAPSDTTRAVPPPALKGDDVGTALGGTLGMRDYGPLKTEARLSECLEANGIDGNVRPVGVRQVTIDGERAVLVVLTTGELAKYRMVALPTNCGPGKPGTLVDRTVGGGSK